MNSQKGLAQSSIFRHARTLSLIALVSGIGTIGSVVFQTITIRILTPSQFGLVAALLAIANLAAVGSAALRNSVAVDYSAIPHSALSFRRIDRSLVESIAIGVISTFVVGLLLLSSSQALNTDQGSIVLVVASVIPYFISARSTGLLQGAGHALSVVVWSTASVLLQVVLVAAIAFRFATIEAVLTVMLIAAAFNAAGSSIQSYMNRLSTAGRYFPKRMVIVLITSVALTWLSTSDTIFVRIWASEGVAGQFAAAAAAAKVMLLVPAALSMYLLPKFVRYAENRSVMLRGVYLSLTVSLGFGVALAVMFIFFAPIILFVLGDSYRPAIALMPSLALALVPLAGAQAVFIRILTLGKIAPLVLLISLSTFQALVFWITLPNISEFLAAIAIIGTLTVIAGVVINHRTLLKSTLTTVNSAS